MDKAKLGSERSDGPTTVSIEEYERLYRALRTLSAGNRTLARASDEQALLRDMVNAIVDQGGYRMAWIGYTEHDEWKTIRVMAHAGVEDGIFKIFPLSWADEIRHPTALALQTGAPRVSHLLLEDPALAQLHAEQRKRGYVSVSAFPLIIDGRIGGNLSIIASEADAFHEEEVNVLAELAEDVAFGIAAIRSRKRREEAEAALRHIALHDGVTGLPNRALFCTQVEALARQASSTVRPFAIGLLAIDQFREVNEMLGIEQGNALLREVVRRFEGLVEGEDLLARVSDDEFALLWSDSDADRALRKATRVLTLLEEPLPLAGLAVDARARLGIALYPGHGTAPDVLMRRAALAAREARQTAGRCTLFTGGLDRESSRNLTLVAELHRAITGGQLRLYCQPKIDVASRRLCGAEALVRWAHPVEGMIGPDRFVKLAENAGLITPLTDWVLGAAFRQLYAWQSDGFPMPLAINLSARDLLDARLVDRIRGHFLTWGVEPANVQFELTESALLEDPSGSLETLNRLKDLGVQLAVDDFGTGYSSLSYLQRLPADSIKIDQSFVGRMTKHEGSDAIVRSTIDLGHDLGLSVTAEGVEDLETWRRLAALKCDLAQGYLVSRPLPADEVAAWRVPEGLLQGAAH